MKTSPYRKIAQGVLIAAVVLLLAPAYAAGEGDNETKKMALVHLLVRAGKNEEAANAMRSIYPKGPPPGAAALEYYSVVGNSASGWEEARHGLEKLVKAEPGKLGYQLALAQLLTLRPETQRTGMQMFSTLARQPDTDNQLVLDAWREALTKLDDSQAANADLYRDYLAADPDNSVVRAALADAQRAETKRQPWELRDKADAQLAAGHPDDAIATLKQALQLDPKNAWVRFDLSRLYHKQGNKKQGRTLMEEGLTVAPGDADMLYANALYASLLNEASNALHLLDKIPATARSQSMQRLRQKMVIQTQTQQAQAYARKGNRNKMQIAMNRAEAYAGNDAEYINLVAKAWIELRNPARGTALMRRLASRPSASIATRLYYAELLNRAEQDDKLAAELKKLSAARGLADDNREALRYLKASLAARRSDNARHAGNLTAAFTALEPALEEDPENTDLLMAEARLYTSAREPQKASDIYRKILQRTPGYLSARRALAWALTDMGDRAGARQEMSTVLANASSEDASTRASVAEWYLEAGELDAARAALAPALKQDPDNADLLLTLARIHVSAHDETKACDIYQQILRHTPGNTEAQKAQNASCGKTRRAG